MGIILLSSTISVDVGVSDEDWSRMVYRYFLAAKIETENTGSADGMNLVLNEPQIENMINAQERLDQGAKFVQVNHQILEKAVDDLVTIIDAVPETCAEGNKCKTPYHTAHQNIHCVWSAESFCVNGCDESTGLCKVVDPCLGIVCEQKCIGKTLYRNGICIDGSCDYTTNSCSNICNVDGLNCQTMMSE